MFGKESDMKTDEGKISTVIAKGTKRMGNIDMQGCLRIDGHVKGQVNSTETLTVGSAGVVDGEVRVKEAIVGGKIMGNLMASQRVELENSAAILGDVKTRIFVIKEGGVFHGQCSMREEAAEKPKDKSKDSLKVESKPMALSVKPPDKRAPSAGTQLGKV
jgi:cytoskeletal protein CcmA (bactofilin family)